MVQKLYIRETEIKVISGMAATCSRSNLRGNFGESVMDCVLAD